MRELVIYSKRKIRVMYQREICERSEADTDARLMPSAAEPEAQIRQNVPFYRKCRTAEKLMMNASRIQTNRRSHHLPSDAG
jgi:hypothetical protein